jgi:cytoskeletal protein RodZ
MAAGFSLRKIKQPTTLGTRLKRARKRLKADLLDVEIKTKIRSKYLEALEADDFANLPADAYTKGFVIRYAKFLGISQDKALNDYFKQKSQHHSKQDNIISPHQSFSECGVIITPKIFTPIALILVVVGMFSYLAFQIYGFAAAPELSISYPTNNSVVVKENIEILGNTSQQASVFINNQRVHVSSDGSFSANYKVMPGINVISIKSINRANKEKMVTYTLEYKPQSAKNYAPGANEL